MSWPSRHAPPQARRRSSVRWSRAGCASSMKRSCLLEQTLRDRPVNPRCARRSRQASKELGAPRSKSHCLCPLPVGRGNCRKRIPTSPAEVAAQLGSNEPGPIETPGARGREVPSAPCAARESRRLSGAGRARKAVLAGDDVRIDPDSITEPTHAPQQPQSTSVFSSSCLGRSPYGRSRTYGLESRMTVQRHRRGRAGSCRPDGRPSSAS